MSRSSPFSGAMATPIDTPHIGQRPVELDRLANRLADAVRQGGAVVDAADRRLNDRELVAAEPRQRIGAAQDAGMRRATIRISLSPALWP